MFVCLSVCLSVCLFFPMERSDWSGTDQSGRGLLRSRQREPSDWSGSDQSGLGVLLSCQTECFDWTGERSVLIGRELTNQDAEFF